MTPQQRKTLERLAKALSEASAAIDELLSEPSGSSKKNPASGFLASEFLASVSGQDRSAVEQKLAALKQQELGAIFVEAGGASTDRKKPKTWLVEQILWRLFDFNKGHDAIRSGAGGN